LEATNVFLKQRREAAIVFSCQYFLQEGNAPVYAINFSNWSGFSPIFNRKSQKLKNNNFLPSADFLYLTLCGSSYNVPSCPGRSMSGFPAAYQGL
jgi:hypothetical protein